MAMYDYSTVENFTGELLGEEVADRVHAEKDLKEWIEREHQDIDLSIWPNTNFRVIMLEKEKWMP